MNKSLVTLIHLFVFVNSVMAWIEGRPYPKIVRSYMDGTNMEIVISNSTHAIVTPMDIAIDSSGKHVYCSNLNVNLALIIFYIIFDTHKRALENRDT